MKNSQEVAKTIKLLAKQNKIAVGKMLSDCGLSINTLSSMQSGGFYPRVEAIVKIADYLDCSVDYLLGRTDVPEINSGVFNFQNDDISNVQIAAYSGKSSQVSRTVDEEIGFLKRIQADEDE